MVYGSTTEYLQSGITTGSTYEGGNSNFDSTISPTLSGSRALSTRNVWTTLHAGDVDGDNQTEMLVLDGNRIEIYSDVSLTLEDAITLTSVKGDLQLHDIDNDSIEEIIIVDAGSILYYKYNDSSNDYDSNSIGSLAWYEGDPIRQNAIKCRNQECGVAYVDCRTIGFASTPDDQYCGARFQTFNSSDVSSSYSIYFVSPSLPVWGSCYRLPLQQTIAVDDIDADGDNDWVVSMIELEGETTGAGDNEVHLYIFNRNGSSAPVLTQSIDIDNTYTPDLTFSVGDFDFQCPQNGVYTIPDERHVRVTPPLIMQVDGAGEKEIVIGIAQDEQSNNVHDFKIITFDYTLSFLDDYPEGSNIEGGSMSNIIKTKCFPSATNDDFLGIVYNNSQTGTEERIICGSDQNKYEGYETITWDITTNNASINRGSEELIHSIQTDTGQEEILTTYGIYQLSTSSCDIFNVCDADLIYEWTDQNYALFPIDYENEGYDDIFGIGNSTLKYYNDAFVNTNAEINGHVFNPCARLSTVKVNETLRISIEVVDIDDDDVQARAIIYYGESNEQDTNWSALYPSGTLIDLPDLILNETTNGSTVVLMGRDDNHDSYNTINYTFEVGINGIEFNDYVCTVTGLYEEVTGGVSGINLTETDTENNSIRTFTKEVSSWVGLGESLVFLLIILIIMGTIWFGADVPNSQKMAMVIISGLLMFIIGVYLGLIHVGVVIAIVVCAVVMVAIWLRQMINSGA